MLMLFTCFFAMGIPMILAYVKAINPSHRF